MHASRFVICRVRTAAELDDVRRLFRAYAAALPIDLGYQDFEAELASLPGKYAAPGGALLRAAMPEGDVLGCVALRPLHDGACEMKRLYVAPAARGTGLGRALIDAILAEAVHIGYREMRLDTLDTMHEALHLYRRAGFSATAPYYATPIANTVFLARKL